MATFVLKNAFVGLGSSAAWKDHTQFVRSVALTHEAETQDETAMGDNSRSSLGALKSWAVEIELNADFASTDMDEDINTKLGQTPTSGGAGYWVTISPTTAVVSATNPRYYGRGLLTSYGPVSGTVGDVATHSLSIMGVGDLNRSTTAT